MARKNEQCFLCNELVDRELCREFSYEEDKGGNMNLIEPSVEHPLTCPTGFVCIKCDPRSEA